MATVLSLAALTACGQTSTPPERDAAPTNPPDSQSPSPSPTSERAAAREQVRHTYLGMWRNYVAAARTPDDDTSKLGEYASGDALTVLANGLARNQRQNEVSKGDPVFNPRVASLTLKRDPARAKIRDCSDSSKWRQYKVKSGELVDQEQGGRHLIKATATKLSDDTWTITELTVRGKGTC